MIGETQIKISDFDRKKIENSRYFIKYRNEVLTLAAEEQFSAIDTFFSTGQGSKRIKTFTDLKDAWKNESDEGLKLNLKDLLSKRMRELTLRILGEEMLMSMDNEYVQGDLNAWRSACIWISQYPDLMNMSAVETENYISSFVEEMQVLLLSSFISLSDIYKYFALLIDYFCKRGYINFIVIHFDNVATLRPLLKEMDHVSSGKIIRTILENYCQDGTFHDRDRISECLMDLADSNGWSSNPFLSKFLNYDCFKCEKIHLLLVDELLNFGMKFDINHDTHTFNILSSLLSLWSSATFIINASFEYQMRVAVGIVSGCKRIKETGTENFMPMKNIQQKFMEAIPKYLDTPRHNVSMLGMIVAEIVCKILTPSIKLCFNLDPNKDLDWLRSLGENQNQNLDLLLLDYSQNIVKKELKDPMKTSTVQKKDSKTEVKHPYFPVKSGKDKTPTYIYHALKLIKGNAPDDIQLGLEKLEHLIVDGSDVEVSENVDEICSILLGLQDDYNISNFDLLWSNALIALCVREGSSCYDILLNGIFSKDVSITTKLRCIRVFSAIPMILENNLGSQISKIIMDTTTMVSSLKSKTSSFYCLLFTSNILKRLSIYKNWDYIFDQSHNAILAQRLLNALNLMFQLSINVCTLESIEKYSLLLSSLVNHSYIFYEVIHGVGIYLNVVINRSLSKKYSETILELISIAEGIANRNQDERIAKVWFSIKKFK